MDFSQKLMELRKSRGWSQEQLGDKLGVTRQTVSKWELGQTTPEMEKLAAMSDLFGVSTDELIKGEAPRKPLNEQKPRMKYAFEYKSSRTVRGIPLVHVNVGLGRRTARGIFAIGNKAVGVVSLGFLSVGVVSLGLLSAGIFAFGTLAAGLLAFGAVAVGAVAFGGAAVGILAFGGVALGKYALGGAAYASDIAAGGVAHAKVAIGDAAEGLVEIHSPISEEQARSIIESTVPGTPGVIRDIFTSLANSISSH